MIFLFILAGFLLCSLFLIDSIGIETVDNIHTYIKENKTITKEELVKKLGNDYKIHKEGNLFRYVWMKHSIGNLRFLTVYFDENGTFIKHKYSVNWEDVE